MIIFGAVSAAVAAITTASAAPETDTPKTDPLVADRPGFSNGTGIVQKGHFQIEGGFHQQQGDGFTTSDYGDGAVIRYGLVEKKFEVRLNVPSYRVLLAGAGGHAVGLSDTGFGVKYYLADGKGKTMPSLAILAQTTFISGSTNFRSDRWIPEVRLLSGFTFDDTHSLTVNLGYIRSSDFAGGTYDTKEWGALYSWTQGKYSPFFELFGFLNTDGANSNSNYYQVGVAYAYAPMIQFDAYAAKGLNGPARDLIFGFGVGIKF